MAASTLSVVSENAITVVEADTTCNVTVVPVNVPPVNPETGRTNSSPKDRTVALACGLAKVNEAGTFAVAVFRVALEAVLNVNTPLLATGRAVPDTLSALCLTVHPVAEVVYLVTLENLSQFDKFARRRSSCTEI